MVKSLLTVSLLGGASFPLTSLLPTGGDIAAAALIATAALLALRLAARSGTLRDRLEIRRQVRRARAAQRYCRLRTAAGAVVRR